MSTSVPHGGSDQARDLPVSHEGTPESIPERHASILDTPAAPTRDPRPNPNFEVRNADLEPYVGLRYLSRLFKLMAVVLVLLLVSEIITGLMGAGTDAVPTLLAEASRLVVLAGLLWGSGDLAILLIDMGHDMRATRILMGRQLAHHIDEHHGHVDPVFGQQR